MRSVPSGTRIIWWTTAASRPREVVAAGLLRFRVANGDERDQPLACDDVVDEPDRALLTDCERRHRLREDDRLLEREHRQPARHFSVLDRLEVGLDLAHVRVLTMIVALARFGCCAIGSTILSRPRS